jgi:hypothetical protein
MFEPRPEIRIAIGLRSGIVRCAPAAVSTAHRAPALSGLDPADAVHGFARALKSHAHAIRIIDADDSRHADAAIEGPSHLLRRDVATLLKQLKNGQSRPVHRYDSVAGLGQNPRNILKKPATGDMRETLDLSLLDERKQ